MAQQLQNLKQRFGSRMENRRIFLGISRQKLVKAIHAKFGMKLDPLTIRNWEKGTRWPAAEKIEMIAEILNVSPDELLGEVLNTPESAIKTLESVVKEWRTTKAEK